jgi:hypothetical protein
MKTKPRRKRKGLGAIWKLRYWINLYICKKYTTMTIVRINERSKQVKAIINMLKTFDFVKVIAETETKLSKTKFLNDFKKSLKEVKDKMTKPLSGLLNGK